MHTYRAQVVDDRIQLSPQEIATPEPGAHQLLVRVHAAGMNRGELLALHRKGASAPVPLGMEAAGEVLRAGPDTAPFQAGARVMGRCAGSYSEYALMDARDAMPIPERLSWTQAAALPIATMVVYDMLVAQGHLAAREWLLVAGISSGVGVTALQLAKALGARVIGTSGSERKLQVLKEQGLEVGLRTREPDFHDAVMAATDGRGANLVVNAVGGSVFSECLRSMALGGRLAMVGYLDGSQESALDLAALHSRRLTLFGVSSKQLTPEQRQRLVQGVVRDVLPLWADGRLAPLIDRTYAWDQLPQAVAYLESDTQLGKVVVTVA
ncbi:NADPH:quinone reductase-like Zn-dependent oxidoreductase OS=Castellaniella defragrans OX=75697 GN=HNR28_001595 PE=4 SV=1 [Castellaniella defragrans]